MSTSLIVPIYGEIKELKKGVTALNLSEAADIAYTFIIGLSQDDGQLLEDWLNESSSNVAAFNLYILEDSTRSDDVLELYGPMKAIADSPTAVSNMLNNTDVRSKALASGSAVQAFTESNVAMSFISSSDTVMGDVVTSATVMDAVVDSVTAMNAVAASEIAMEAVAASRTAMNAITASTIAMDAITASEVAMDAVTASEIATGEINSSNMAIGKFSASLAGLDSSNYADMDAVAASSTAMDAVVASKSATESVVASVTAMEVITASEIAMDAVASSENAVSSIILGVKVVNGEEIQYNGVLQQSDGRYAASFNRKDQTNDDGGIIVVRNLQPTFNVRVYINTKSTSEDPIYVFGLDSLEDIPDVISQYSVPSGSSVIYADDFSSGDVTNISIQTTKEYIAIGMSPDSGSSAGRHTAVSFLPYYTG